MAVTNRDNVGSRGVGSDINRVGTAVRDTTNIDRRGHGGIIDIERGGGIKGINCSRSCG